MGLLGCGSTRYRAWVAMGFVLHVPAALGQPMLLDPVVVTAQRNGQSSFDSPAAISAVTRDTIESAGLQVNLSESLNRLPGISVLNRQNYAQDLQLSIRGFGARSTFGIRGVRLVVDGIPATMPDGQGQASTISLPSAARIEVLRGPLAQLYGNAAGGVVQVFTIEPGAGTSLDLNGSAGSFGQRRIGATWTTASANHGLVVDASRFETDGYRDHSAARRSQLNARWHWRPAAGTQASVVVNALEQPLSLDPLGLTRAQWEADPRQAPALAISQDARKSVRQRQAGAVLEHALAPETRLSARIHAGARELDNALSTPPAAQAAPTSSGGIVEFARTYSGAAVQATLRVPLGDGRFATLTAGLETDRMREDRQGHVNDGGVRGELKRNELNTVRNTDVFAQGSWDFSSSWTVTAGARRSKVRFTTSDRFITPDNPDDSGRVSHAATNPVLGLAWRASPGLNIYANAGRGFETPTFTELAYRSDGTGLNTLLRASRSRHHELGFKWKASPAQRLDVAVFDIATQDEIVVDSNAGGRSTFRNAGRTSRRGVEVSYTGQWRTDWTAALAATAMRARFDDSFQSGGGTSAITVPAGNRLPGVPQGSAFAELRWTPATRWSGLHVAAEVVHTGRIFVNDTNDDAAPFSTVLNLRAGWQQRIGAWRLRELLRLENATDRRHAGSVIVNEANRRFFEPAMPRHWSLSLVASYAWP